MLPRGPATKLRLERGDGMADSKVPADIAKLSFEDALDELQALVRTLEKGESKLDQAVQSYERGVALKRHCEIKLREAQAKVDKIVLSAEGAVSAEPAGID